MVGVSNLVGVGVIIPSSNSSSSSSGQPGYEALYFNTSTPYTQATTVSEIETALNTSGFTIEEGKLYVFKIRVVRSTINGFSLVEETYKFKNNNTAGTWGTSSTNGVVSLVDFIYEDSLTIVENLTTDNIVYSLGNIGSQTIQFYLNNLDVNTLDFMNGDGWEVLLNNGTTYTFHCVINGFTHVYDFIGTVPKTVGLGNDTVFGSDFDLITFSGNVVNIGNSFNGGAFNGVFDVSEDRSVFYDDYLVGAPLDLSISAIKKLGAQARVKIQAGLINSIPLTWFVSGDPIENDDLTKVNELTLLYVSDTDINVVNRVFGDENAVEPEYQAMLDYALANSFELPGLTQQGIDNKKVKLLKQAGIWDELDKLHIFNATYTPASWAVNFYRINWLDPTKYLLNTTAGKEPDWVSGKGFKSIGANGDFVRTGFIPNIHAVKSSIDNWSEVFKTFDAPTTYANNLWIYGGRPSPITSHALIGNSASNQLMARLSLSSFLTIQQTSINRHYHLLRENFGIAEVIGFRDGVTELSKAAADTAQLTILPEVEQYMFGYNENGTPVTNVGNLGISYFATGSKLFNERLDFYNILNIQSV